ncbi:MAG: hypothetical protein JSV98_00380 [candidate division WOR-3 bacterium]|nr:MAG: hypothetical protein JSV98_00380 [candidate division WOR-3 bacterium]
MVLLILLLGQSFTAYFDSSLAFIGLTRADLTFRSDYVKSDDYRFDIIDSLLKEPLVSSQFVERLHDDFCEHSPADAFVSLTDIYKFELTGQKTDIFSALEQAKELLEEAFPADAPEIMGVLEELIRFSPEPTGSIAEERAHERAYDSLTSFLRRHARQIDCENIFLAGYTILSALEGYSVGDLNLPLSRTHVEGVSGDILYYGEYDFGEFVIGDLGANIYERDFAIIIDIGGNDTYRVPGHHGFVRVIIDESGDDSYLGGEYNVACGRFGVSIVLDRQGDDLYRARSFSIGAGLFGVGVLIDESGDDRYHGDTFTQGAGCFGIGILSDLSGNDHYEGALYAQGFASTYGIGILGDANGNDRYIIRPVYLDEIRYLDHYLSMSQGFAIGFRPDLPAGIGLLFEGGGNDYYISDIFGQGAAYWYGIGAIVERGGNDNYIGYQYVQGSGTHIALGLLIDDRGDDNYVAKGVAQGCGHDLSLGFLYDRSGDDTYASFDLSQGAGNANGIGLLIDEVGDDTYAVKRSTNTQGYGDFRREFGSIGVLLDIRGDDSYTTGGDAEFWEKGTYGIGADWE